MGFEIAPSKEMQAITLMICISQDEIESQKNVRCLKRLIRQKITRTLEIEANVSEC
mgnify:FL=1